MTRKPHVKLYSRPDCHLCTEAKREIQKTGYLGEYTFEEIDFDTNAELVRRFRMHIPVVTIDEVVVFKHRLTADEFRSQLRSFSE